MAESGAAGDTALDLSDVMTIQGTAVIGDQHVLAGMVVTPLIGERDKHRVARQVACGAGIAGPSTTGPIATRG